MPAFVSPVADPASWSYATVDAATVPAAHPPMAPALRYAGYAFRGVRATRGASAGVQMPATGVLRQVADGAGRAFVEVQVNPFPIRRVASAIPGGLPTFYLIFDDATGLTFADGDAASGGTMIRTAAAVTIVAAFQDRMMLDPALWAEVITTATTVAGGGASQWQPFATAVADATATGDTAPVLLYDHAGRLRATGTVDIVLGVHGAETTHRATLDPADGGDLQRTIARLHAADGGAMPIANLWGGGVTSFRLRPVARAAGDAQLVRLEDGTVSATEITLTPTARSAAFTDLTNWFARQYVSLGGGNDLARFSRGNLVTPLVDGPAYFDDFFATMRDAQRPDGGVHLTGWAMFPQTKFTKRKLGDDPQDKLTLAMATPLLGPDNIPLTLEQAAKLISDAGGAARFLPAKFVQIEDSATISAAEALAFEFLIDAVLILNAFGVSFARTDAAGGVLLFAAWLAAMLYTAYVIGNDGKPVEPNKAAVDVLSAVTNSASRFAPYPARVEDNVPAPPLTSFPFDAIFTAMRHFGIYHQKMSIVKAGLSHIGYCGGIDCNPDRLDTADHLAKSPYHDVHARLEGNVVHDLALTFEQRWQRDGGGPHAFDVPAVDPGLVPGRDIAQIARTYFAPAPDAPARALPFAPNGDRTIADSMVAAITQARELIYIEDQYLVPPQVYRDALIAKVASRAIRQLIIVVPGILDLLFGDAARDAFVNDLVAADAGAGIVRIGYPRRRFTSTDNELRASSGKMLLGQDLAAGGGTMSLIFLGPPARIPDVPFWVSVEGELIYVYDESGALNPDSESMKVFLCERGDATQVVLGIGSPPGVGPREHKRGAPATAVDLSQIYVHAKMMIVDDVFLGLGSANLNRRGLFYDGEVNCFTIPDALRASPRNPALLLRRQLWAEMMDLPPDMAAPLLSDPIAAARLFDRSPFAGNRFTPLAAQPPHLMLGYTTGDGAAGDILQGLGFTVQALEWPTIYQQITDPTSRTESTP